jgi:hypothetical protein
MKIFLVETNFYMLYFIDEICMKHNMCPLMTIICIPLAKLRFLDPKCSFQIKPGGSWWMKRVLSCVILWVLRSIQTEFTCSDYVGIRHERVGEYPSLSDYEWLCNVMKEIKKVNNWFSAWVCIHRPIHCHAAMSRINCICVGLQVFTFQCITCIKRNFLFLISYTELQHM